MSMKWFSKKAGAICIGALMGVSATFLAMIPSSRDSEAAIAVIDQKNIEEAVKTAIQTANILTEEQKQYALMILNMKKLDTGVLAKFIQSQANQEQALDEQYGQYQGLLNKTNPLETIWNQTVGDFNSVLSGKITIYDMYKMTKSRQKQAEDTFKDVHVIMNNTQQNQLNRLQDVQQIQEASNNAEGELQAIQAGTAMTGTSTQAIIDGNNIQMGQLAVMQQEAAEKQAARNASVAAVNLAKANSDKYLSNYDASKNMYLNK